MAKSPGSTKRTKSVDLAGTIWQALDCTFLERLLHRTDPSDGSLWRWDKWGIRGYVDQAIAKLSWARVGHGVEN